MDKKYKTEQEKFWAGQFGNEYTDRTRYTRSVAMRTAVLAKIFSRTRNIRRVLEFGTNVGYNLLAIKNLLPHCEFSGIEINDKAADVAAQIENATIFRGSILDYSPETLGLYDMTMTSGVLIHIEPAHLPAIYSKLYNCSRKYILVKEYYNPTPVMVPYRGHTERLFKRDFAGEMLDLYNDLEIVDYGFQYHRDYNFPADDSTWFLLLKK